MAVEPNEKPEDDRRRSLYTFQRRSLPQPMSGSSTARVDAGISSTTLYDALSAEQFSSVDRGWNNTEGVPVPARCRRATATPIPRTLAQTKYADLDISIIDELPPGRTPIETFVVRESRKARVYDFVRKNVERGHQAYVVAPAIESRSE